MKAEVNWGLQSKMTLECRPNQEKTGLKKSGATPALSISLVQGQKITPFVRPWSSMTITESKPLDRGKPEIRLIEIEENGVEASTVRGVKLETVE